ncbi:interferon-induced, double-stranded RNA-activated protein kinase-like [Aulostomus maculatus]
MGLMEDFGWTRWLTRTQKDTSFNVPSLAEGSIGCLRARSDTFLNGPSTSTEDFRWSRCESEVGIPVYSAKCSLRSLTDSPDSALASMAASSGAWGPLESTFSEWREDSDVEFEEDSANKSQGSDPSDKTTPGTSRFVEEFHSIRKISEGGFGEVFKATHKLDHMDYAIKIVLKNEKAVREVQALSKLRRHPNVVEYHYSWVDSVCYQHGTTSGSSDSCLLSEEVSPLWLYIQMELCTSRTLKGWMEEKNSESPQNPGRREESLHLFLQVARGVQYIHANGFIHRDLKPVNIMFKSEGQVKIGDFGLVAVGFNGAEEDQPDRTEDTGSPVYMAPEQTSQKRYSHKADMFPLGLIYFELLQKILTNHERSEVLKNARWLQLPETFPQMFPQETRIIKQLLCESPEDRPEAGALVMKLEGLEKVMNMEKSGSCLPVVHLCRVS